MEKRYELELLINNQQNSYSAALNLMKLALRASFILNGGALGVLLAYLGTPSAHDLAEVSKHRLFLALLTFAIGVTVSSVAVVTAFFAQENNTHADAVYLFAANTEPENREQFRKAYFDHWNRTAKFRMYATIIYCASLALFLVGSFLAYWSLTCCI